MNKGDNSSPAGDWRIFFFIWSGVTLIRKSYLIDAGPAAGHNQMSRREPSRAYTIGMLDTIDFGGKMGLRGL